MTITLGEIRIERVKEVDHWSLTAHFGGSEGGRIERRGEGFTFADAPENR